MKTRTIKVLAVTFTTLMIYSCTPTSTNTTPLLTTIAVSGISAGTATAGGTISSDGGATVTARGVCWNTATGPTTSNTKTTNGTGTGTFSATITGLTASTTYYARAYATNAEGTNYGDEVTFTTSAATAPTLTTTVASSIGATTATTGGNVTSDGGAAVTARGICWSTTTAPTVALSTKTSDGTGAGTFTSSITGLTALTTYYARAYATNSVGTVYGNEISFSTTAVSANTAGTLVVSFTTTSLGGQYSPANIVAIWVKNSSGIFVKSLLVYAASRKSDLTSWSSNSARNTTDAITGATQSNNAARSCTWNATNTSATVVANGNYTLCMEINDGSRKYYEYSFAKGATAVTLSPVNVTGFSNISVKWTPN